VLRLLIFWDYFRERLYLPPFLPPPASRLAAPFKVLRETVSDAEASRESLVVATAFQAFRAPAERLPARQISPPHRVGRLERLRARCLASWQDEANGRPAVSIRDVSLPMPMKRRRSDADRSRVMANAPPLPQQILGNSPPWMSAN
jgi:hypothetical protein